MLPTKFRFIWPGGFRGEDFVRNQRIRNKNGLCRPYLLTDWDKMTNLNRGPSIDASFQISVHVESGFRGEDFLVNNQSKTRMAGGGHVY